MKDWDALYEECIHCQKCGLAETRTNVVFGEGDRDAEVMFIGEGPGEQEDRTGRPFVGRAGSLTWTGGKTSTSPTSSSAARLRIGTP